jgi:glycosyltransferase involved in cell wall biosynthesis
MRLMFVYWQLDDAGSAQTIFNYSRAARELGHEIVLYAPENPESRVPCSLDVDRADAVLFLLEWNIYLHQNRPFPLEEPLDRAPRWKRIVIDDDGMYNDDIRVDGDYNHPSAADSATRTRLYDSISDTILQPTLHPVRDNVRTFLFHGYDPAWERPLEFTAKEYGMVYVGSNWFRWRALQRLLAAVEPVRERVGRMAIAGHGWEEMPWWIEQPLREDAYYTDPAYLQRLGVELMGPIPIDHVVATMSRGVFNPVLVRPTFNHFRLVNPRLFETVAAGTIPLFNLDADYVREIYGDAAVELVIDDDRSAQVVDILERPNHYAEIAGRMRRHLAERHSFSSRVQELVALCGEVVGAR